MPRTCPECWTRPWTGWASRWRTGAQIRRCRWRGTVPRPTRTSETITEYVYDCGCCQPVAAERRVTKAKRPPGAILRGDGGYDSREPSPTAGSAACAPRYAGTIDASCLAGGKDRTRSEAVLKQMGGGCTAARFARMGMDERKKHQE